MLQKYEDKCCDKLLVTLSWLLIGKMRGILLTLSIYALGSSIFDLFSNNSCIFPSPMSLESSTLQRILSPDGSWRTWRYDFFWNFGRLIPFFLTISWPCISFCCGFSLPSFWFFYFGSIGLPLAWIWGFLSLYLVIYLLPLSRGGVFCLFLFWSFFGTSRFWNVFLVYLYIYFR